MSPILNDLILTTSQENLLPGIIICTLAILLNIPRIFIKNNESLKWISLILFALGILLAAGGAAKTASIWANAKIIFQEDAQWKVEATPGLIPGTKDILFSTRWDELRIPKRTYQKLQEKYPETLEKINF